MHFKDTPRFRVEPIQDAKLNQKLFQYYGQLIQPLKQIENFQDECTLNKLKIKSLKEKMQFHFVGMIGHAIIIYVVWILLVNIYQWKVPFDDINGLWIYLLLMVFRRCFYKNIIKQTENLIKSLEFDIGQLIEKYTPYIKIIPPAYRYSEAVAYFVDSYINSRVNNLQEAVNKYDEYLVNNELLKTQHKILEKLCDINYEQLVQEEQLKELVKNSKSKIDISLNL